MTWKNLPYWLRGGIISLLIVAVLYLILISLSLFTSLGEVLGGSKNILLTLSLGTYFVLGGESESATIVFGLIVEYFIIGAVIGLIIGKLKSKKSQI